MAKVTHDGDLDVKGALTKSDAAVVLEGDLSTVATTGAYADLSGKPTLGTAADNAEGDFATAAQGALADSAVQPGDTVPIADGGTGATTGAAARTNLGVVIGTDVQAHSAVLDATTASFLTADETKLDAVEALADVTDATNVTAAGAVMDAGAQTVAGVKTFSSSPVVPQPATTDGQTVPKSQLDTAIAALLQPGYGLTTGRSTFFDVEAIEIEEFMSSGTYIFPTGARFVKMLLKGAGGGGAAGYRGAVGTNRYGGGGGASGVGMWVTIPTADLNPAGETVTIGAAGAGGAALSIDGVGNPGTDGGATSLTTGLGTLTAGGGQGGNHVSGLAPGNPGRVGKAFGGGAFIVAGLTSLLLSGGQPGGGGAAGSSFNTANAVVIGGSGGGDTAGAGGTAGAAVAGASRLAGTFGAEGGGGGGGNTIGSGGQAGGSGGFPGGGGGGGMSSTTGTNSGAGGAGAAGLALFIAVF